MKSNSSHLKPHLNHDIDQYTCCELQGVSKRAHGVEEELLEAGHDVGIGQNIMLVVVGLAGDLLDGWNGVGAD